MRGRSARRCGSGLRGRRRTGDGCCGRWSHWDTGREGAVRSDLDGRQRAARAVATGILCVARDSPLELTMQRGSARDREVVVDIFAHAFERQEHRAAHLVACDGRVFACAVEADGQGHGAAATQCAGDLCHVERDPLTALRVAIAASDEYESNGNEGKATKHGSSVQGEVVRAMDRW